MNHRSLLMLALSACLLGQTVPARAATYKIRWYLGHRNLDYFEEAARDFKKTVEAQSKGDITVDIILQASDDPQGAGWESDIAAKVASGQIEMGHSYLDVMGSVDPRFHAFEAPFLFRGYRHLEGVFEGPLGAKLLADLGSRGIQGLSFTYSGGANGIATTSRPLRTPADLKGLRIGCYGDAVDQAWLRSLGAVPVPIAHRLDSIQRMAREGKLDGVVITWRNFEQESLDTTFNYFNLQGSSYLVTMTYINKKYFEAMPKAYRDLISKASIEAGRIERARTIELNEDARREMVSKGVQPVYLTELNSRRFLKAVQPAYTETINSVLGSPLVKVLRATRDAPENPAIPEDLARVERTKMLARAE